MFKKIVIFCCLMAFLGALFVVLVTVGCEDDWCYIFPWQKGSVNSGGGIEGRVVSGPQCPVERLPLEEKCEDKPLEAEIAIYAKGNWDTIYKLVRADKTGFFKTNLKPGIYVVKPVSENLFPSCPEEEVIVEESRFVQVSIECDTGIR